MYWGTLYPKSTEIYKEHLQIISKADHYQVKELMDTKVRSGKISPDINIFKDLLHCGYCLHEKKELQEDHMLILLLYIILLQM